MKSSKRPRVSGEMRSGIFANIWLIYYDTMTQQHDRLFCLGPIHETRKIIMEIFSVAPNYKTSQQKKCH